MDGDTEACHEGSGEEADSGGGADEGEGFKSELEGPGVGATIQDDIYPEILHGAVEEFFHGWVEAMDFVDEEHIAFFEAGEDAGEVSGALECGAAGGDEVSPHLAGDDVGQGGFSQSRRPVKKHMIQRLPAGASGFYVHAEIWQKGAISDKFV
jgi:hypothetical protein